MAKTTGTWTTKDGYQETAIPLPKGSWLDVAVTEYMATRCLKELDARQMVTAVAEYATSHGHLRLAKNEVAHVELKLVGATLEFNVTKRKLGPS